MKDRYILFEIKQIPILLVAEKLGIQIRGRKAMCFRGHDKLTPSLSFMPSKNIWKCFGCGQGGDVINLVMQALDCDFKVALEWFKQNYLLYTTDYKDNYNKKNSRNNYEGKSLVTRIVAPEESDKEKAFYSDPEIYDWVINECSSVKNALGLKYLSDHGISSDNATHFGVREMRSPSNLLSKMKQQWGLERVYRSGLAWGENGFPERLIWTSYSVLFPFIHDGKVVYIQGRLFEGNSKYLNPRGISKPIFNLQRLNSLKVGSTIHICEGITDAIAIESLGLASVAVLGASSFREEWLDLFMRYDIVILPDGDSGGEIFFETISKMFKKRCKAVYRVSLPLGKDVSDLIAEMKRRRTRGTFNR